VRAEELVAESYSASNEWPSAVIHFENALVKSPKLPGLHVELGEVYLHAGKLKLATAEFNSELHVNPDSLRALVRRGEAKLLQGETSDALADWERALDMDSVQVQQILGMRETGFGDAAFEQIPSSLHGRFDQIAEDLKDRKAPADRLAVAFVALQNGKSAPAIGGGELAPKPKSCSRGSIAELLQRQHYSQLAHCANEMLAPSFPSDQRVRSAGALVAVGEYQLALRLLNLLPLSQRQAPEASYWLVRCYEKLATAAYLKMYQVDPDSFRVHQLLGDLAATRNDDGKAIEEYRAAVKLNPGAPTLHYSLGHILWKDLRVPEARVELLAELKINPRHAGTLHDLGDSYLQEHQPEKALPYLSQAVSSDSGNPDIHRDLGTAYSQLKEYTKAEPEYKIALANDQDGSVHYKLAKVYQELGEKQKADREFALYTTLNQQSHERLEKRGQRLADIERLAE
jgi:tetratricopeptide (TPR) repeat protein